MKIVYGEPKDDGDGPTVFDPGPCHGPRLDPEPGPDRPDAEPLWPTPGPGRPPLSKDEAWDRLEQLMIASGPIVLEHVLPKVPELAP